MLLQHHWQVTSKLHCQTMLTVTHQQHTSQKSSKCSTEQLQQSTVLWQMANGLTLSKSTSPTSQASQKMLKHSVQFICMSRQTDKKCTSVWKTSLIQNCQKTTAWHYTSTITTTTYIQQTQTTQKVTTGSNIAAALASSNIVLSMKQAALATSL